MEGIFREIKTQLRLTENKNVNFAAHVHDDVELVYVRRGGGTAMCDGRSYPLQEGSIFLAFPNQIHSYRDCADGAYILVIIHPSRLVYLEAFFRQSLPASAVSAISEEQAQPLIQALAEYQDHGDSYVVDGYLTAFFGKLFQTMPVIRSPVPNDTIPRILQYCSGHYRQPICVQELCDHLHVSRSYVSHMFSQHLKLSFTEYINSLRLNKAVTLLEEGMLNITQVAEAAGFPTVRTFNRVFRQHFACSPSAYKKR